MFLGSQLRIFEITESSADVGRLTASAILPILSIALLVPKAISHFGPRRVSTAAHSVAILAAAVALLAAWRTPNEVWSLYLLACSWGAASAAIIPSRLVAMPMVTPQNLLARANSRFTAANYGSILSGPALTALILTRFDSATLFALAGAGAVVSMALPIARTERPSAPVEGRTIKAVVTFIKKPSLARLAILVDLTAMVSSSPRVLLPAIGTSLAFHGGSVAAILFGAIAVGGLSSTLLFRSRSRPLEPVTGTLGLGMLWGCVCAGLGLVLLPAGLDPAIGVVLVIACLFAAGFVDGVLDTLRQTIVQSYRGPVGGPVLQTWTLVIGVLGPRLGDAFMGEASEYLGLSTATIVGGLLCSCALYVVTLRIRFGRVDMDNTAIPSPQLGPETRGE